MTSIVSPTAVTVTMTSIELVDFINASRSPDEVALLHKNFIAKVPLVLGESTSVKFLANLPDSYGRPRKGYCFPKREACLMAMSYSYELQARVYDCMTVLEQQAALAQFNVPKTLSGALRLAADESERADRAEAALSIAAPKAEALDLLTAGDESLTLTQTAKLLGIQRKELASWMCTSGWHYRQNGTWVAYEKHIRMGHLKYKEAFFKDMDTGQQCMRPYCHILPKGLAVLADIFVGELQ